MDLVSSPNQDDEKTEIYKFQLARTMCCEFIVLMSALPETAYHNFFAEVLNLFKQGVATP